MATTKTKQSVAALAHVLTYMLPFLFLRPSWPALFVIVSTHFVIDRWRLARIVVWLKNWLAPFWRKLGIFTGADGNEYTARLCKPAYGNGYVLDELPTDITPTTTFRIVPVVAAWEDCKATGYPPNTPAWLAVWLLIIADNIMHVCINGLALKYL